MANRALRQGTEAPQLVEGWRTELSNRVSIAVVPTGFDPHSSLNHSVKKGQFIDSGGQGQECVVYFVENYMRILRLTFILCDPG